ncbi:O-antigen ligase family protein [Thiomicrorhabdus arctica]|uniref:O-antigen ligase family protein n=1 Tax=Thiomicrorhabdus arctica TaxID=131540 RepID=UPI00037D744D|nr:hypothetical protein [Thiomicrorhabdus arctica]
MLSILYSLGYFAFVIIALKIFIFQKITYSWVEKLLIFSVSLIPLGKLIYFPIPGLTGLKFSFIYGAIVSFIWLMVRGVHSNVLFIFMILIIPLASLLYIENINWVFLYKLNAEQNESSALRFLTILILVLYSTVIYSAIYKNPRMLSTVAEYFILGTIYASIIGAGISLMVLTGNLDSAGLEPISAGVHIIHMAGVNFYRFNPGANVNEFSMILAYAIFLTPFTKFSKRKKYILIIAFLILEFATLTRASWLALILSTFLATFFMPIFKKNVKWTLSIVVLFLLIFFVIYNSSQEVKYLIDSRTSFNMGASGQERLEKFEYVFNAVSSDVLRLMFGFGWATNMYVHNVPLQLLYEVGLIGLLTFVIGIVLYTGGIFRMERSLQKGLLIAILAFIIIVSFMHHNLYHVQTWFMLGFIAVVAALHRRQTE